MLAPKTFGFTLVELLVALGVASMLLAVGAPALSRLIKDNRMVSGVNEFVAGISAARMEAVRRGARIVLCKSSDQASCATASGIGWRNGWIVFVDTNANGVVDTNQGDVILRAHGGLHDSIAVTADAAVSDRVRFNASGRPMESGQIKFCDDRQGAFGRVVELAPSGRVRLLKEQSCP